VRIDAACFDHCIRQSCPQASIPLGDGGSESLAVPIESLDDFHPDQLFLKLGYFEAVRATRSKLLDRTAFRGVAANLGMLASTDDQIDSGATASDEQGAKPAAEPTERESDQATLGRLLGNSPGIKKTAAPSVAFDLDQFIKKLIDPHAIPADDPDQQRCVAAYDKAIGSQMRSILHSAAFQRLEATWRGLHWLVTHVETSDDLQIEMLHASKEELDEQLLGADPSRSMLFELLAQKAESEASLASLIVCCHTFADSAKDLSLLQTLGGIGSKVGAPVLAAADASMFSENADEARKRWDLLRASPVAAWIGLATPRILLRLPYGPKTDPIDAFEFSELPQHEHQSLLWGNPALAVAHTFAEAFVHDGWAMQPERYLEVTDLPFYAHADAGGDQVLQVPAEFAFNDVKAHALVDRGLMPLVCNRQTGSARFVVLRSIASPPQTIRGPWCRRP
jgi:type VI secretion system protein ImpC